MKIDIQALIAQMTFEEKAALCTGARNEPMVEQIALPKSTRSLGIHIKMIP